MANKSMQDFSIQSTDESRSAEIAREVHKSSVLGLHLAATQLGQIALALTDTIMVSWLGTNQLAAVGIVNSTTLLIYVSGLGMLLALMPLLGRTLGSGMIERVPGVLGQGYLVAAAFAAIHCVALIGLPLAMPLFGQDRQVSALTFDYAVWLIPGALPAYCLLVLRNQLSILERTRPIFIATVVGVVLNAVANYVLLFGAAGIPAIGIGGAAISTSLVAWTMLVTVLLLARGDQGPLKVAIPWHQLRPVPAVLREILDIGWPISAVIFCESLFLTAATFLAGLFGPVYLAAFAVATQIIDVFLMVPIGISQAATARVSIAVPTRRPFAVRVAGFSPLALATAFMLGFWGLCVVVPDMLVQLVLFDKRVSTEVIGVTIGFLAFAGPLQFLNGAIIVIAGALRGLTDTKAPLVLIVLTYWVVGLGSAVLLSHHLDLGVDGIWYGLLIGFSISLGSIAVRFLRRTTDAGLAEIWS